jgi:EpsI family protein
VVLVVAGAIGSFVIESREETVPRHVSLQSFPMVIEGWSGRDSRLDSDVLDVLKVSDYLVTTYSKRDGGPPVELYVAYYDSQRKGASVHSPRACLPGGGWQIQTFERHEVPGVRADGTPLPVNRVVIGQGSTKALVYYWFMQRGRYLTSEYMVKWYIFWDALTRNRTDGALVRVLVPIPEGADVEAAEERLAGFVKAVDPKLYYHIPQEVLVADAGPAPGATALR